MTMSKHKQVNESDRSRMADRNKKQSMKPSVRVQAALARRTFDRPPIKHLAVAEVDRRLSEHFGVRREADLLDCLGHDFREIRPDAPTANILAMYEAAGGVK